MVQPGWTGNVTSRLQNVGSDAKHQYKQTKSTQNNKRDSCLIFAAVVCVYWYTGLPLVCYRKIFALNVNVVEIFFQILFVWQENDLVFSSVFEKIKLKQQRKNSPPPCTPPPPAPPPPQKKKNPHTLKFNMLRVQ